MCDRSPQYGVPGGPDAIISLHCDGKTVELPVHACFLQTLFTKAEPIGFQGRTAIFNGGSPFTMQLFVLLYEYMYHGDVEPMYRILTGLEGPKHEQIISATEGKWVCASQIINRRPMSVLESMGRKTLALWSMALVGGVYDRSVYTVLNIVWWLLGGAFIEQHADPNIQGWMDDIYAEWRRKAAEISSERFDLKICVLAIANRTFCLFEASQQWRIYSVL